MSRYSIIVVAASSMLISIHVAVVAQSPDETQRDSSGEVSDPKAALLEFYSALADEDVEQASQFLLQPKKMNAWIKSQTELSASFTRWNNVVTDMPGDNGSTIVMPNPIQVIVERSKNVGVTVKGDVAEVPVNKKSPMTLRRIENTWKLDLFSAYENPSTLKVLGVTSGEKALSLVTLKARKESKMLNAIASEVNAGQLTTPDQVRQRVRTERDKMNRRMLRAMQEAAEQTDEREPE